MYILFLSLIAAALPVSSMTSQASAASPQTNFVVQQNGMQKRNLLNCLSVLPLRDIQNLVLDYLNGYDYHATLINSKPVDNNEESQSTHCPTMTVQFSPNGLHLVTGGGNLKGHRDLTVWDTESDLFSVHRKIFNEDHQPFTSIIASTFSLDSEYLAATCFSKEIGVWKKIDGKYRSFNKITFPDDVHGHLVAITFSPDKKYLIVAGTLIFKWKFNETKEIYQPHGGLSPSHEEAVTSLAVSPTGSHMASISKSAIKIWRFTEFVLEKEFKAQENEEFQEVAWIPGTNHLLCASEDKLLVYADCGEKPEIYELETRINAIAVTSDGKFLAVGLFNQPTQIWSIQGSTLKLYQILEDKQKSVRTASFSPAKKYLVTGSQDGSVVTWKNQAIEILLAEKAAQQQNNNQK